MKTILVTGLVATALLTGCGGGGGDDALRKEVEALRQQVAATSTTTAPLPTTVSTEASTTTTQPPVTTTVKPPTSTTQRVTTTTQRPTTTTVPPPTTTTTVPYVRPEGTVTWAIKGDPKPTTNNCMAFTYTIFNRSDSALKEVSFANVYNQEGYPGPDGRTQYRWGNPTTFPKQTVAAGIAAYGQGDVSLSWCPPSITPGSTSQFPVHHGELNDGLRTAVGWVWFSTYPGTTNHAQGCCAWWDSNTKTGHQ